MQDYDRTGSHTEVPADAGGLPQLNVIDDGSWTNQVFWAAVTFVALYLVVSRLVLPRVAHVIENRDEKIRADLDKADQDNRETESITIGVEQAMLEAKTSAYGILNDTKAKIQADITAATATLDAAMDKQLSEAEASVAKVRDAAMADIQTVAADAAKDIVMQLTGVAAKEKAVTEAVAAAINKTGGAG